MDTNTLAGGARRWRAHSHFAIGAGRDEQEPLPTSWRACRQCRTEQATAARVMAPSNSRSLAGEYVKRRMASDRAATDDPEMMRAGPIPVACPVRRIYQNEGKALFPFGKAGGRD